MIFGTTWAGILHSRKRSFPGALGTALGLSWTSELLTGSAKCWAVRPLKRAMKRWLRSHVNSHPLRCQTIKSKHSKPESLGWMKQNEHILRTFVFLPARLRVRASRTKYMWLVFLWSLLRSWGNCGTFSRLWPWSIARNSCLNYGAMSVRSKQKKYSANE